VLWYSRSYAYLLELHAMKTYGRVGGIAPPILTSAPLYFKEKLPILIVYAVWWAPDPVLTLQSRDKSLVPTGNRNPNRPALSILYLSRHSSSVFICRIGLRFSLGTIRMILLGPVSLLLLMGKAGRSECPTWLQVRSYIR
jgi:hypothetical protein